MKKIAVLRMKLEGKVLQHLFGAALFGVFVFGYWADKIEALSELLEEFLEDWLHISYRISDDMAITIIVYALVVLIDWFVRFGVARIAKLFKKQPTQETEVSE